MDTLFGVPIDQLLVVVAGIFGLVAVVVALLAIRNRVAFFMGVRNVPRRRAQTVLIVLGLMLATVIFSASLATGDTLTHSIRVLALRDLGQIDLIVRSDATDAAGRPAYFDASAFDVVEGALTDIDEVAGVAPRVHETAPVMASDTMLSEPSVSLLGIDDATQSGFDRLTDAGGQALSVAGLGSGEVYLSDDLAESLGVAPGDQVVTFLGPMPTPLTVAGVYVDGAYPGGDLSLVMPLAELQTATGNTGQLNRVVISNHGDPIASAGGTEAVLAALQPALEGTGLRVDPVKQDALAEADEAGSTFAGVFLIFGQFSIAAGIMLIFLIFVMLAAERKKEMGIARAVGMQRSHLVRMFAFEGAVYALLAGAVGALLGVAIGWGMVGILSVAFGQVDLELTYLFRWQSLALAYLLGVVFTFAIVATSAWWVSRLNIVRAIRDIPEPRRRRRSLVALVVLVLLPLLGALLIYAGIDAAQGSPFLLGVSLLIIGIPLLARWFGLPDRAAYTIAGLGLVVWWLLPDPWLDALLPGLPDFSLGIEAFFLSGIMIVIGAVWAVMFNADLVLAALVATLGRVRGLPPLLRTALSYPMQNRFRTGMTLAMFSLVVFTLVVMSFILHAIGSVFEDTARLSGGFDVRASVSPANPIVDLEGAIAESGDFTPADFAAIGGLAPASVEVRPAGTDTAFTEFTLQGADAGFTEAVTYDFAMRAEGYGTSTEIWQALQSEPNTVVVAAWLVPARASFAVGGMAPPFQFEGFWLEDRVLPEVYLEVRDPRTGSVSELRVIGVLDSMAFYTGGAVTSADTLAGIGDEPVLPLMHMIRLAPGADAEQTVTALRLAFAEHGLQAVVLRDEILENAEANLMINNLLTGFMALGLVVGIAALGVIAARSVVERRQEIGVMRALGFQREMVQASFLIESSFVALLGITLGMLLGGGLSYYVVDAMAEEFEGLTYQVPWATLLIVIVVAYGASLLTTFLPAYQASRVRPAEALHQE